MRTVWEETLTIFINLGGDLASVKMQREEEDKDNEHKRSVQTNQQAPASSDGHELATEMVGHPTSLALNLAQTQPQVLGTPLIVGGSARLADASEEGSDSKRRKVDDSERENEKESGMFKNDWHFIFKVLVFNQNHFLRFGRTDFRDRCRNHSSFRSVHTRGYLCCSQSWLTSSLICLSLLNVRFGCTSTASARLSANSWFTTIANTASTAAAPTTTVLGVLSAGISHGPDSERSTTVAAATAGHKPSASGKR